VRRTARSSTRAVAAPPKNAAGRGHRASYTRRVPQFSVNTNRLDPYKSFRFRVKWDNRFVPGLFRVSPLRRTTAVVDARSGADTSGDHRSPGRTDWDPIVLERGRTHDTSFEDWANLVWNESGEMSLQKFHKDLVIELQNEQGTTVMAFKVHRAWPSEYVALGQLDSESEAIAIESLTLEHEGWERDLGVAEPAET
jgi:phage tail-like protein